MDKVSQKQFEHQIFKHSQTSALNMYSSWLISLSDRNSESVQQTEHQIGSEKYDIVQGEKDMVDVYRYIAKNQLIGELPIAAMVSQTWEGSSEDCVKYSFIKSKILVACIVLEQAGGHESSIKAACDRVRLLSLARYEWLFKKLPDFQSEFKNIVEDLKELREAYRGVENCDTRNESRVADLHVLLRDYIENRPPIVRTSARDRITEQNFKIIDIDRSLYCEPKESYREILEVIHHNVSYGLKDNIIPDIPEPTKYLDIKLVSPPLYRKNLAIQASHAREFANKISMKEQMTPCDWNLLTEHEVNTVFSVCYVGAERGELDSLIICLMLITGRGFRQLIGIPWTPLSKQPIEDSWLKRNNKIALLVVNEAKNKEKSTEVVQLTKNVENFLYLLMPKGIFRGLSQLKAYTGDIEDLHIKVKEKIKNLNDYYNLHISEARLIRYIYHRSLNLGVDEADVAIITGLSPKSCPALYYYSPLRQIVYEVYLDHVRSLLISVNRSNDICDIGIQAGRFGDGINVDDKYVSAFYGELASYIEKYRSHADPVEFHNAYVLFVYELLTLATGFRSVTAPFESIKDINIPYEQLWISDKEVRSGLSARIHLLPKIAIKQLVYFKEHIKAIKHDIKPFNIDVYETMEKILSGDKSLLGFFSENKYESLSPRSLKTVVSNLWPLPLNWQRHYMRTRLRECGLEGKLVDAWMGHARFGQEATGRWSGMSIHQHKNISDTANKIMNDLSIKVIKGWGYEG